MYAKLLTAALAFTAPLVCVAASPVTINANSNCLSQSFGTVSGGTPLKFQLAPGRYVFSLVSNNMSCSSGGCPIDTVIVQGGWGNARWGKSVTATPTVIDMTQATVEVSAYVSDNACHDNTGTAVIQIETAS